MSFNSHAENRTWALEALDNLQDFLEDSDYEGNAQEDQFAIERKRKELKEGKYRVVLLGAFNVGKSMMVNAFLGDGYLPTVLEECTTKVTHIAKGDTMRTRLSLTAPLTEQERQTLETIIDACGIGATVVDDAESNEVVIEYAGHSAKEVLKSLNALVTMSADEDFPQLRSLRAKFEEIFVTVPIDPLEEDIALVDSPGVHSISETNRMLADDIIPNSHLVLCLIDSQTAGNEQSRDFIKRIVDERRRKMFFVINKADQLNRDEIDPAGRRGPAKDLMRSLVGIVDEPEVFFVSSLYALIGKQLMEGRISLEDIDENNKIKIPFTTQLDLFQREEPVKAVGEYLLEQSNFAALRARLLNYVYHENREGAILESVCRFIDPKAWALLRPLEAKLEMAREMPRLEELAREKNRLNAQLESNRKRFDVVLTTFKAMSTGGDADGVQYEGYETMIDNQLTPSAIKQNILAPVDRWLSNDQHFHEAKKAGFEPLREELKRVLSAFADGVQQTANESVDSVERTALAKGAAMLEGVATSDRRFMKSLPSEVSPIQAGLGASYVGFAACGAVVGAAAGAVLGGALPMWPGFGAQITELLSRLPLEALPQGPALAAGATAAVGGLAGLLFGLIARGATAKGVLRRKLEAFVAETVDRIVLGQAGASVRSVLKANFERRRQDFAQSVEAAFNQSVDDLHRALGAVLEEEAELKRVQAETIARLEPKVEALEAISVRAREIAQANAPAGV